MYHKEESLGGTGDDKIAGFLTLTNMGAAIGIGGLAWGACRMLGMGTAIYSVSFVITILLTLAGAGLGIALTVRWTGISLLDKVILGGSYYMKRAAGGTLVLPPTVAPPPRAQVGGLTLVREGRVVARPVQLGDTRDG